MHKICLEQFLAHSSPSIKFIVAAVGLELRWPVEAHSCACCNIKSFFAKKVPVLEAFSGDMVLLVGGLLRDFLQSHTELKAS